MNCAGRWTHDRRDESHADRHRRGVARHGPVVHLVRRHMGQGGRATDRLRTLTGRHDHEGPPDMTQLPDKTDRKMGLVIDLDTCVGCHACVVSCKGWNTENYGAPLSDQDPYGADPSGTFLNRIHSYEVQPETGPAQLVHFPKSCLHCEDAPCVTVCPTGASYKRTEDGIVLVNESDCIGCGLCAWACPYGAREMDQAEGVMKKCTLCVDRIYHDNLPEEDRVPV